MRFLLAVSQEARRTRTLAESVILFSLAVVLSRMDRLRALFILDHARDLDASTVIRKSTDTQTKSGNPA